MTLLASTSEGYGIFNCVQFSPTVNIFFACSFCNTDLFSHTTASRAALK